MLKPFFTSSRRFLDLAAADLDGNTPLHLLCRFGGIHPAALDADFGLGLPLHGGPRGARSYSRGRSRSESRSVGRLGASPARQYPPSANRARARSRSRTRLESASHSRGRSSLRGGSVEPGASDEGLARGHPVLRALQLLLSHGSDPNAANFKGQRPLHLLLANRFLQDVLVSERSSSLSPSSSTRLSGSRLLDPEEKAGPLLHACARQLLGERADASAPDGRGVAPLFEAAVQQDSGLLELLVRHGAETNYAMPRDLFLTYVTEDGGAERASEDQLALETAGLAAPMVNRYGGASVLGRSPREDPTLHRGPLTALTEVDSRSSMNDASSAAPFFSSEASRGGASPSGTPHSPGVLGGLAWAFGKGVASVVAGNQVGSPLGSEGGGEDGKSAYRSSGGRESRRRSASSPANRGHSSRSHGGGGGGLASTFLAEETVDLGEDFVLVFGLLRSPSAMRALLRALERPPVAVPDLLLRRCMECKEPFSEVRWRHHCRHCARLLCHSCSSRLVPASAFPPGFDDSAPLKPSPAGGQRLTVRRGSGRSERVCDPCMGVLALRRGGAEHEAAEAARQAARTEALSQSLAAASITQDEEEVGRDFAMLAGSSPPVKTEAPAAAHPLGSTPGPKPGLQPGSRGDGEPASPEVVRRRRGGSGARHRGGSLPSSVERLTSSRSPANQAAGRPTKPLSAGLRSIGEGGKQDSRRSRSGDIGLEDSPEMGGDEATLRLAVAVSGRGPVSAPRSPRSPRSPGGSFYHPSGAAPPSGIHRGNQAHTRFVSGGDAAVSSRSAMWNNQAPAPSEAIAEGQGRSSMWSFVFGGGHGSGGGGGGVGKKVPAQSPVRPRTLVRPTPRSLSGDQGASDPPFRSYSERRAGQSKARTPAPPPGPPPPEAGYGFQEGGRSRDQGRYHN